MRGAFMFLSISKDGVRYTQVSEKVIKREEKKQKNKTAKVKGKQKEKAINAKGTRCVYKYKPKRLDAVMEKKSELKKNKDYYIIYAGKQRNNLQLHI